MRATFDQGDKRKRNALAELDTMAADLERQASAPGAREAARLKALAEAIKARTARLR
jgi:hypothetical protein